MIEAQTKLHPIWMQLVTLYYFNDAVNRSHSKC